MADISKITLPGGTTYNIKDEVARQAAAAGVSFVISNDAAGTPKDVSWNNSGTTVTGTLVASASTTGAFYLVPETTAGSKDIYSEYVTVKNGNVYSWEKIGTTDIDLSDLGSLAYKSSATGSFTPAGTISAPTVDNGVSRGVFYFPTDAGSVTNGTAASATMPVFTTSVLNETLTLGWTSGSFTPNVPTSVTLPGLAEQEIVVYVSDNPTVSQPVFTGTQGSVTVS